MALGSLWNKYSLQNLYLQLTEYEVGRFALYEVKPGTVVLKRESKWHDLWSKWPISDLMFYNIKMPPSSCPLGFSLLLTGALKWGTVQTSTSTYTGIMQGQT